MSQDLTFSSSAWAAGGQGMSEAAQELVSKTQAHIGSVSDLSALGTDDTLGSICQMIYQAVLERVQQTAEAVGQTYDDHGDKLNQAAKLYAEVERGNADASSVIASQPAPGTI